LGRFFALTMAFVVDGNNVMGQTPGWHRDKPRAKRMLLEKLATFARLKKARITVVFDGGPDSVNPDGSAFHGVKIFYAKPGSDADNRIVSLVESSTDPRGLTVVTSDRNLGSRVRSVGCSVMRSGEFRRELERRIAAAPVIEDGSHVDVADIDSWLRYFGSLPEDDLDES
jgi:predicted RNA-binding protein with PIN domain